MWIVLCILGLVSLGRGADGALAEQMAETTQICCNQGTTYARGHSSEDCSSSVPPDVPSAFSSLCIFAMDQCCKDYFIKKRECDAGVDLASSSSTCDAGTSSTKNCCQECARGRSEGTAGGIDECAVKTKSDNADDILASEAFTQCCKRVAAPETGPKEAAGGNSGNYHTSLQRSHKPLPLSSFSGSSAASLCEEYAPNELCAHHCIPVPGSYKCECNSGYMLMADGRNCKKVVKNRCKPKNPCQHKCNDNGVEVKCSCRRGYQLMDDGKSCEDIDECQEDLPVCLPSTKCFNVQGSYKCIPRKDYVPKEKGQCPPGFSRNARNNVCDDINECALPSPPCPAYLCENTVGGYKCGGVSGDPANLANNYYQSRRPSDDRCPPGFSMGFNEECEDVDECALHKDDCNPLSQFCINTRGGFYCQNKVSKHCHPGFKSNPVTNKCEDIDECEDGEDICRSDQVCVNVPGEYDCKPKDANRRRNNNNCPEGMRMKLDTNTCEDIDECVEGTHLCDAHQRCLNTNGSHECRCKLGYEIDPITGGCVDVNECATGNHNCVSGSQRCDNTIGSFICVRFTSCGTGYTLQATTGECEDIDECALGTHNCMYAGKGWRCENHVGSFRCVRAQPPTTSTSTTSAAPEYEYEYYDSDEEEDTPKNSTEKKTESRPEEPATTTRNPLPTDSVAPSTEDEEVKQPEINLLSARTDDAKPEDDPQNPDTPGSDLQNPEEKSNQESHQPEYQPSETHQPEYQPTETRRPEPPETLEPEYHQPETTQSEYQPPETRQPEYQQPETRQPEYQQPETRQPEYQQPETRQPEYQQSKTRQPEYQQPETRQPEYQLPETHQPEYPQPETRQPEYQLPETHQPEYPQPETRQPEYQLPETHQPEYSQPETRQPEYQPTETRQPDYQPSEPGKESQDPDASHPELHTMIHHRPKTPLKHPPNYYEIDTQPSPATPKVVLVDVRKEEETATVDGEKKSDGSVVVDTGEVPERKWITINGKPSNCRIGFELDVHNGACVDIDECASGQHSCNVESEHCRNTMGGYLCECAAGFMRDLATGDCHVLPTLPPSPSTTTAPPSSKNYFWGYPEYRPVTTRPFRPRTLCDVGYHLNSTTNQCEDIDECHNGQANCAAVELCINTDGGYRCECPPNWRLDMERQRCVPLKEGGGMPPGYGNEPVYPPPNQHELQQTFQGSKVVEADMFPLGENRSVFTCPNGYKLGYDNTCEDIDECSSGEAHCGEMLCTNLPGGYVCSCPPGHRLVDGNHCRDVDECDLQGNVPICSQNADCVNTVGSYQCRCHKGFRSAPVNDKVCVDVDECTESAGGSLCQHRCNNVWGGYRCSCHRGYRLNPDNSTCADVDECTEHKSKIPCVGRCVNEPGSYRCTCPHGYRLSEDKRSCIDIDECETGEAPCAGAGQRGGGNDVCLNTRGGYRCQRVVCPLGYRLEGKHRCTRIEKVCPPADWDCAHQPTTYSYNFITFVSNLYIPDSKVDLFTMRGPNWPNASMRFQLRLVNVDSPPSVKHRADISSFLLVHTGNQAVMSLVRSLEGPQSIELELSMELYNGEQFGGIAVARLYIYVSEFEF